MTAEIGILNRLAVALAADSAVSLGGSAQKVYTSAEKLFHLSISAPVAAMVYGNAAVARTPWEIILKSYRQQLGAKRFSRLDLYLRDLLKYISRHARLFPPTDQRQLIAAQSAEIALDLLDAFKGALDAVIDEHKTGLSVRETRSLFSRFVRLHHRIVRKQPRLDGLSTEYRSRFRRLFAPTVRLVANEHFGSLTSSAADARALQALMLDSLLTRRRSQHSSGLVVAGFGEDDYYPTLVECQVLGYALGKPLHWVSHRVDIPTTCDSCVVPFAQQEMVYTFMEGIDPDLKDMIEWSSAKVFEQIVSLAGQEIERHAPATAAKARAHLARSSEAAHTQLVELWNTVRQRYFWRPVVSIASALPKDEVAAMAAALVNLTKFKRRVSHDQETVGGPIDIALITKGEGFVWIQRKHYFSPELNPRYMARIAGEAAKP